MIWKQHGSFLYHSKTNVDLSLNLKKKYITCDHFFKLWGFKVCHINVSGDLIRLRNWSKLVEGSLFAIIDLLIGAKSTTLYLI